MAFAKIGTNNTAGKINQPGLALLLRKDKTTDMHTALAFTNIVATVLKGYVSASDVCMALK